MASLRFSGCFLAAHAAFLVLTLAGSGAPTGFLQHGSGARFRIGDAEFQRAMETVLGCGAAGDRDREATAAATATARSVLEPMWRVVPKNGENRVEWRVARYLAHRYFLQRFSLIVRGLEPARQVNDSHAGAADVLTWHAPDVAESLLDGRRSSGGFSLEDMVTLVITLEQAVSNAEASLLEEAYRRRGRTPGAPLSRDAFLSVMESYLVHWLMFDDPEMINIMLVNQTVLEEGLPRWGDIRAFTDGLVKSMDFSRNRAPRPGQGRNVMRGLYYFEDALEVVTAITRGFASFWEAECQEIKHSLIAMDSSRAGRVPLSDFYGANSDGEWRFSESEAYLRELGALDETLKQVIIPNYLHGANNCIVTNTHYFICCINECEAILADIEEFVGGPVSPPAEILLALVNVTNLDDEPPRVSAAMGAQLERIAETHGGRVPLHGRLFAQWLHYVLPYECPFPHKVGTVKSAAPMEFKGGDFVVSESEVNRHTLTRGDNDNGTFRELAAELDDAQWMAQWSEEEELIADAASLRLRAPWELERRFSPLAAGALALLAVALAASLAAARQQRCGAAGARPGELLSYKTHLV